MYKNLKIARDENLNLIRDKKIGLRADNDFGTVFYVGHSCETWNKVFY